MHLKKAATIVVAALCIGLAIGGSILLVGLQFHRSLHVETGDHAKGRPAVVKEEPEGYWEKWIDPVVILTTALAIVR